jgi:hypothetical protein
MAGAPMPAVPLIAFDKPIVAGITFWARKFGFG